jgi:hypothetical protein
VNPAFPVALPPESAPGGLYCCFLAGGMAVALAASGSWDQGSMLAGGAVATGGGLKPQLQKRSRDGEKKEGRAQRQSKNGNCLSLRVPFPGYEVCSRRQKPGNSISVVKSVYCLQSTEPAVACPWARRCVSLTATPQWNPELTWRLSISYVSINVLVLCPPHCHRHLITCTD